MQGNTRRNERGGAGHLIPILTLILASWPLLATAEEAKRTSESEDRSRLRVASSREAGVAEGEKSPSVEAAPPAVPIIYTPPPPSRGAPRARTAGGTRSAGGGPRVSALAPPHVAWTSQRAPDLFWHIDVLPAEGARVMFSLIDDTSLDPIASFELPTPTRPGIQRVRLEERGVTLEEGVEYEWSVSVVVDPERRSRDIVGRGWLQRVEEPAIGILGASVADLAARSLWYDAFELLSDEVAEAPGDAGLHERRRMLLRQAELGAIAD